MINHNGVFLAIDQSTSATKALLFTPEGILLDQQTINHQQIYPFAGWVEHDADEIYKNMITAVSQLLHRHPDKRNNILALSLTNQRETFVIFERNSGKPIHNAIVWQCMRGVKTCKVLAEKGLDTIVHQLTGLKIDTYFPASKIHWLLNDRPEISERLREGSVLFGTIDTYLIYRLTGGKVYATDQTNASRTLLFDVDKLNWSQELFDLFSIPRVDFPEVRSSSDWYGDTDLEGLLDRRIPIYGVMGDSQAALFAQRCFTPGSAKVTFGTGSSILLNIGNEKRLSKNGILTALGWVVNGIPTYAYEGIINFTGATIAWLRDQLNMITTSAESEEISRSVSSSEGVYLVPAFIGLAAPYWRADARAAILGMTPSTTRAHIVRAAVESIGYIVTDVLNSMSQDADISLDTIFADGGAVSNNFLMQFVSDMSRKKLSASQLPELSALGAVFNGGLGLKIHHSLDDLLQLPTGFVHYEPKLDSSVAKKQFDGWQKAVQQILYQPK
ncbi:MAG: glycerol kinase [Chloroflexi bacterium HGW-Chloroflexi-3]|nr:MAG: glycerol kinase [Chloroflexi bacterium HGW-Chloroflexi-3]